MWWPLHSTCITEQVAEPSTNQQRIHALALLQERHAAAAAHQKSKSGLLLQFVRNHRFEQNEQFYARRTPFQLNINIVIFEEYFFKFNICLSELYTVHCVCYKKNQNK